MINRCKGSYNFSICLSNGRFGQLQGAAVRIFDHECEKSWAKICKNGAKCVILQHKTVI